MMILLTILWKTVVVGVLSYLIAWCALRGLESEYEPKVHRRKAPRRWF